MRAYAIRRLFLIIPTLVLVTILVFLLVRFIPGSALDQMVLEMSQYTDNPEEFEDVPLVPTAEQIAEANKMFEALHPAIRKRCPEVGVYLVESSS